MIRCYFVIHADVAVTPTEPQWLALINAAKNKPLAVAIIQAARASQEFIQAHKRSMGAGEIRKWTLCGFEITDDHIATIADVVNAQSVVYGCSGTLPERFICVLQAELQEAATDLGWGGQAANLTIDWYTYGTRAEAIAVVQAYIAANHAIWHDYA